MGHSGGGLKEELILVAYNGVVITTGNFGSIQIGFVCPRGARLTMHRIKISIDPDDTVVNSASEVEVALHSGAPMAAVGKSDPRVRAAKFLWMDSARILFTSVTAVGENVLVAPKISVDLDYEDDPHPGVTISPTPDTPEVSFQLVHWDSGTPFTTITMAASMQATMEWLETSRSTKARWTMDEINTSENQYD